MAGKNSIIAHPQRLEIEKAIIDGVPLRDIAGQYGTSRSALARYKNKHLAARIAQAAKLKNADGLPEVAQARQISAARHIIDADYLQQQLNQQMDRVLKLFDACDEWLQDPDNPDKYTLDPRVDEIKVVYGEQVGDEWVKKRAPLSALLAKLADSGVHVATWEHKRADPRELVLKTANQLKGSLELFAKMIGMLKDQLTVNITASQEWREIKAVVLNVMMPYPKARQELIEIFQGDEA